jgi:hypothetical protein
MLEEHTNVCLESGEDMRDDKRYFHLTPKGWVRQDDLPYPWDRVETWVYEIERVEDEEEVRLVRLWSNDSMTPAARDGLRAKFGLAGAPGTMRGR